jgi:predicted NBD/HSP70 family sugar kinase
LDELSGQNLILDAGLGESTGGRKPIMYRTNPVYGYVFGLEISRITSTLILCDLHMNKIGARRWQMTERQTPETFVEEAAKSALALLAETSLPANAVLGMGIGAVGPLDRVSGTILSPDYFPAPGWHNVPICNLLEQKLGFPVLLDNGANAALLGEHWSSRDQNYQHLLYVHLGVGLRSAMMTGGKLVYGAVDMEGSIGQMIIQTDGPRLSENGNYGSLESFVSIHALEQQARSRLKQGRDSVLRHMDEPDRIQFADLVQALEKQDPMVLDMFSQSASYFGIGLANLLNILHPEKVILGGPLINSSPMYFQICTRIAIQKTYYYPSYQVVFSRGKLGEDALVTGAAAMPIQAMTE